ncbi:MAG: Mur ligase family protein [Candidatus Micrarchaeia archaeon]
MAATYARALQEIYSLDKFGSHLGLERIRAILQELGSPQRKYRCILVGGSNGKGSTTEMIGAVLQEDGARVGTYFSPQIERFEERFRVGGKNAGRREIADAFALVRAAADAVAPEATFFEVVTAMALVIFAAREVDYAVLEVGLGGRLDAVNAVEPEVSVLTSLSLEHADVLGGTIEKIAHEKCGIAREGKPLVCGAVSGRAGLAVGKECAHAGAHAIFIEDDVGISDARESGGKHSFDAKFGGRGYAISLSAPGKFQVGNACCALAACSLLGAKRGAVERGLAKAKPAFRLERRGNMLLDCAHNPEAAAALAKEVAGTRVRGKKVLLFSAMGDKDYAKVLAALAPLFDAVVITEVRLERGERAERLAAAAKEAGAMAETVRDAGEALALARKRAGTRGLAVVAGSIYLLAELFGRDRGNDKRGLAQ